MTTRPIDELYATLTSDWTAEDWAKYEELKASFAYEEELTAFAILVRNARKKLGWSQQQLAQLVGVQQSEISKIERATLNLTGMTEFKVRRALGITKHYSVAA